MAIRNRNTHWKMKDIHRRHWIELSMRYSVVGNTGEPVDALIGAFIERTPTVISEAREQLLPDFPVHVAEAIFDGLGIAAQPF